MSRPGINYNSNYTLITITNSNYKIPIPSINSIWKYKYVNRATVDIVNAKNNINFRGTLFNFCILWYIMANNVRATYYIEGQIYFKNKFQFRNWNWCFNSCYNIIDPKYVNESMVHVMIHCIISQMEYTFLSTFDG